MTKNNEINLAITNLHDYNNGKLTYEWMTLPFDEDDLDDLMVNIGVLNGDTGEYLHEYFISDYEAPFKIGEYDDVHVLNAIAYDLEGIELPELGGNVDDGANALINFAIEASDHGWIDDFHHFVGDIMNDEDIEHLVEYTMQDGGGWARLKQLLRNTSDYNEFHYLNGYGNLEELTNKTLEVLYYDLINEIITDLRYTYRRK